MRASPAVRTPVGWPAVLVLLAWLGVATAAVAEQPVRFHRLGVEQGLPNGNVTTLLQDRLGFLWIGTQSGLFRYDGYQFQIYRRDPEGGRGLSDGWVWALHEDADGMLWIGTQDGTLHRFDPRQRRFELFSLAADGAGSTIGNEVRVIAGSDDALWIGSLRGLFKVDRRSGARLPLAAANPVDAALRTEAVEALCLGNDGAIWSASGRRLLRLDSDGLIQQRIERDTDNRRLGRISALRCEADGDLWIGSADGRLYRLPLSAQLPQVIALPNPASGAITALSADGAGHLWVGSFASGLWRYQAHGGRWRHYPAQPQDPHGLADDRVSGLLVDRSGGLWVASWNHGLHLLDLVSGGLGPWRAADGSGDWQVYSLIGDGGHRLWLGTVGDGVQEVDLTSAQVRSYRHQPDDPASLSHDVVRVVYRDRAGSLWAGTHLGLDRQLSPGRFRHYLADGSEGALGEGPVRALLEDSQGQFWVGGEANGVALLDRDTGQARRFQHDPNDPHSLSHDSVNALLEDSRGRVWIGTRSGLNRWHPVKGHFERWRHRRDQPGSLGHDRVNCLYEDRRQRLWVCTGGGLNRIDEAADGRLQFKVYGPAQGLAAESVGAVQEAPDGRLWLSTTAGLSSLDPEHGQIRNYGAREGASADGYFVNASYAASDRRQLWFGGLRGLTELQPGSMRDNPYPPPVVLTELLLFNSPVEITSETRESALTQAIEFTPALQLDHRQGVFAFEFAALHYADPERNRYAYRLEGFDRAWQETGASRRYASYTNLPPGQYRFRVRASNKDGLWNETGAAIELQVLPPPWRSPWAYLGYLLALLALGGRWYWLRREKRLTERRYHQAVQASEQRLKLALWGSGDGLWDWDVVNDRVYRDGLDFLGYPSEALAPTITTMEELIHPDDKPAVLERLQRLRRGLAKDYSAEFRVRTADGRWLWVLDRGKVVETDPASGRVTRIAGTLKNDQVRKETEQALLQLAKYDPLTGLPNRAMFQERLHAALSQARRQRSRLALLFVDLDHFKHVNDSLGHAVGDALLKDVGQRLRHCLREGDLVARLGGDEFTIMLEGIHGANEVAALAGKLLQLFSQPVQIEGHELTIGLSIGISLFPNDGDEADALLQHADTAMYCAKNGGRNGFQFYTAEMNETVVRRLAIENGLRRAITRGELRLVFQPRMDLASGRFVGAETLARWQSMELGAVAPTEFIPVAEDSGLILPLGEWFLRSACEQYVRWQQAGLPTFAMSVNVSALQLMRGGLVALVARVLRDTGMPAEQLELEITETAVMNNAEHAIEVLRRLKALGVRIAIDDFGIGYSSLSYLKRFPIDMLKIDKSFVLDIGRDPDDATIVSAIIAMAHALQHVVVAEGVENPEQLALLRYQGCDQVQGFYYSQPLEVTAFGEFLGQQVRHHDPAAAAETGSRPG